MTHIYVDVGEGDIEAPKIQEESDGNGIVASVAFPTIKEVTRESRALNSDSNCIVTTVAFPTIKKITRESRALNSGRYEPCHVWIGPYYDPRDSSSSSSQLRSRMDDGREYLQLLIIVAANKPPAEVRVGVCVLSFHICYSLYFWIGCSVCFVFLQLRTLVLPLCLGIYIISACLKYYMYICNE